MSENPNNPQPQFNQDPQFSQQAPNRQADDQQDQGGCHAHLVRDELAYYNDEHSGHGNKKGIHRSIVL